MVFEVLSCFFKLLAYGNTQTHFSKGIVLEMPKHMTKQAGNGSKGS
jgi:hypothetical protein